MKKIFKVMTAVCTLFGVLFILLILYTGGFGIFAAILDIIFTFLLIIALFAPAVFYFCEKYENKPKKIKLKKRSKIIGWLSIIVGGMCVYNVLKQLISIDIHHPVFSISSILSSLLITYPFVYIAYKVFREKKDLNKAEFLFPIIFVIGMIIFNILLVYYYGMEIYHIIS